MKKEILSIALIAFLILSACTGTAEQSQTTEPIVDEVAQVEFKDFGPEPFVFDIEAYTTQNDTYRTAIWT